MAVLLQSGFIVETTHCFFSLKKLHPQQFDPPSAISKPSKRTLAVCTSACGLICNSVSLVANVQ